MKANLLSVLTNERKEGTNFANWISSFVKLVASSKNSLFFLFETKNLLFEILEIYSDSNSTVIYLYW